MHNNTYWSLTKSISQFKNKNVDDFFYSEKFLLNIIKNDFYSVLDIGCASGRYIELLKKYSNKFSFLGIDIVDEQINIAKDKYYQKNFSFMKKDILRYNPIKKFDLVNATGLIQHSDDYKKLILKMVNLSSKYIVFDIKISTENKNYISLADSYIKINDYKLPYIIFSKDSIFDFLKSIKNIKNINYVGYLTDYNSNAIIPSDIKKLYSVGILIEKNKILTDINKVNFSGIFLD